jgi:hypothetical protein
MARNVIHEAFAVLNRPVEIRFRTELTFQVPSLGYDGTTMSCRLASFAPRWRTPATATRPALM